MFHFLPIHLGFLHPLAPPTEWPLCDSLTFLFHHCLLITLHPQHWIQLLAFTAAAWMYEYLFTHPGTSLPLSSFHSPSETWKCTEELLEKVAASPTVDDG